MKTLTWQKPGQQNVAQELIKIIINYVAELRSIMTPDGWKLVRLEVSDPSKTYEELYNIYTDPAETTNVIKQYPDVARKLKNMIGGQRVENARFHF